MERAKRSIVVWRRSIMALLLVAAVATAAFRLPAADLEAPTAQDRQVTLMVRRLMRDEHLSQRKLDDEVSQRAFKSFLKSLDPLKVYFYQKDVDEFAKQSRDLDERVREGNIKFAYTVFRRFLQRVDERVVAIDDLLKSDFDFTIDESLVVDGDTASYPKDAAEARDRWRKRLKFDLLVLETEETEGDEARAKLRRRYSNFAKRMRQTDSDELLEMYLTAVTTSYDPHSTYMSASSLENFRILMRLNLEGIGAALRIDDGYTVVSQVIPGGAADKQGELKPADRIVSVAQGEGEMVDVVDLKLDDVVKLIRGKAGTIVKLGVIPAGGGEKKTISITRAKIELKDSEARGEVLETGKKPNGNPYRIGVINLPSFYMDMEAARLNKKDYKSTTRDVRNILAGFKEEGVDAVLLDLRRNGGGSLSEAISLTGLFVEDGTIVQVKDPDGTVHQFKDDVPGMVWDGPLVVATSKFSASASEILAGAIQDYRRGLVVGDTSTHGKGTVQSLLDLGSQLFRITRPPNLGALKITMQQFYRPNGDSTQKRGVLADVTLPSITDHMDVSEGDLDFAIEFDKIKAADIKKNELVNDNLVRMLRAESGKRVSASEDFAKVRRRIERYVEQKARKQVTLNKKEFLAEREELNADKEDEKQIEEQNNPKDEVFERKFYNNELLDVTADYINLLRNGKVASAK